MKKEKIVIIMKFLKLEIKIPTDEKKLFQLESYFQFIKSQFVLYGDGKISSL